MNIFAISSDPRECAQALDDRRLVKAVLETAQLISTVTHLGYKPTHKQHPVTQWVGYSVYNTDWTLRLFGELCHEYTHRFRKVHACEYTLNQFDYSGFYSPDPNPQSFCNCARNAKLGLDYSHLPVFTAYKEYLRAKWELDGDKARWTNRNPPEWR